MIDLDISEPDLAEALEVLGVTVQEWSALHGSGPSVDVDVLRERTKRVFRSLVPQFHPDRTGADGETTEFFKTLVRVARYIDTYEQAGGSPACLGRGQPGPSCASTTRDYIFKLILHRVIGDYLCYLRTEGFYDVEQDGDCFGDAGGFGCQGFAPVALDGSCSD